MIYSEIMRNLVAWFLARNSWSYLAQITDLLKLFAGKWELPRLEEN